MKSKSILLIGAVAIITLSFSFTQASQPEDVGMKSTQKIDGSEPVGGFAALEITK